MSAAPPLAGPWRDVDGVVLLDKPEGLTSNAALQRVRRAFRARKAGHTGSLDPLASGVLPICLGQATKASGQLLDADKTYRFRLVLGTRTSTGDRAGEITESAPVPVIDQGTLRGVMASFHGESTQVPPMYSALKHEGQRLYRLARAGLEVERAPRKVRIDRLDLLAADPGWLDFEVTCSKGTYVRSLAEDLAVALGTVGHVGSLRRTGFGPFSGACVHSLGEIERAAGSSDLETLLLAVDAALPGLPAIQLGESEQSSILHGQTVSVAGPGAARVRMYGVGGRFLGVGRMNAEGLRLAPERIMVELPPAPVLRA
jgi:tRNA pseudouridine55 synthase